ncbi:hypothetical protein C4N9_11745 [Pararhodobacter marinus]|uniref:DUF2125 domain-containing protein n=1 Tax=Pararhodobacter marinus TaxID=2184063 RepID=A0A2U2C9W4_9RHOB|nr:hypothetical protein [Pararhodobacter marinus]PWE28649.1 hypothetical protein C4N9_11745 [Pararhodobacter marinus]
MTPTAFRAAALASLVSSAALPAFAQVTLTPLSLTARAYTHVTSWQERGFRPAGLTEVVHIPGHVLVDIRAVFDGPWSDEVDQVRANSRDIKLVLPDGTELEAEGSYQYWGQLQMHAGSLSGRRPRDFPDTDQDIHWNSLFVVPEGTGTATLLIGGDDVSFEGPVTIPKTSDPDDPAAFASFDVQSVDRYRMAELEDGSGDDAVLSTITAPPGMVLADLEIEVTGTGSNQADGDPRFNWSTSNFRLIDAEGRNMALVGEQFMRRILDSQFNGVNIGDSTERNVIWLVPEGLTQATLLFGETPVAEVDLGSASVTDTN